MNIVLNAVAPSLVMPITTVLAIVVAFLIALLVTTVVTNDLTIVYDTAGQAQYQGRQDQGTQRSNPV